MYKCKLATTKEKLQFIEQYCRDYKRREKINKDFRVDVEAYEELPPWHSVYNATGSDILLKDSVIMLRISDLEKRVRYYPVFSEKLGRRLLRKWGYELPPKFTVFINDDNDSEKEVHRENVSLRHLLAFTRLFMLSQNRLHTPMAYGFNNLYKQLYDFPDKGVSAETVKLVNNILGDFINNNTEGYYVNCKNLQDFIAYVVNNYTLLDFKENDFRCLREKLLFHYPEEKPYF